MNPSREVLSRDRALDWNPEWNSKKLNRDRLSMRC